MMKYIYSALLTISLSTTAAVVEDRSHLRLRHLQDDSPTAECFPVFANNIGICARERCLLTIPAGKFSETQQLRQAVSCPAGLVVRQSNCFFVGNDGIPLKRSSTETIGTVNERSNLVTGIECTFSPNSLRDITSENQDQEIQLFAEVDCLDAEEFDAIGLESSRRFVRQGTDELLRRDVDCPLDSFQSHCKCINTNGKFKVKRFDLDQRDGAGETFPPRCACHASHDEGFGIFSEFLTTTLTVRSQCFANNEARAACRGPSPTPPQDDDDSCGRGAFGPFCK